MQSFQRYIPYTAWYRFVCDLDSGNHFHYFSHSIFVFRIIAHWSTICSLLLRLRPFENRLQLQRQRIYAFIILSFSLSSSVHRGTQPGTCRFWNMCCPCTFGIRCNWFKLIELHWLTDPMQNSAECNAICFSSLFVFFTSLTDLCVSVYVCGVVHFSFPKRQPIQIRLVLISELWILIRVRLFDCVSCLCLGTLKP